VASSSSPITVSSTPIDSPSGALTPISDDKISTSSTSVSDYFKEKMAKLRSKPKWMAESTSSLDLVTPPSLPYQNDSTDVGDRPRTGIGARNALVHLAASTSASVPFPSSFPVLSGSPPASEPTTAAQGPPSASSLAKDDEHAGQKDMRDTKGRKEDKKKKPRSGESTASPVIDGSMNVGVDDDGIVQIERRAVKKKRKAETDEGTIPFDVDADREGQHKNMRGKKRKARHDDS